MNAKNCLTGPMSCIIIALGILYIISPIDFLPEALLGPFGLIDDFIVGLGLLVPIFANLGGPFKKTIKNKGGLFDIIGGKKI